MVVVAISALFTACSDEGHWDGYNMPDDKISFAQSSKSYSLKGDEDAPSSVTIEVYRTGKNGELTIPVNVEIDNALMSTDSESVTFANGSDVAQFVINVDNSAIEIGVTYSATVSLVFDGETLTEENASLTGATSCKVSIIKDYTWQRAGKIMMASNWAGVMAELNIEKALEYNTDGNLLYRILSPYYFLEPSYCPEPGYHLQFVVDANGNAVSIPMWQNIGEEYDAGYNYYLYCNPAQGHSFTNNGNVYTMTGLWAVRSETTILGAVGEAKEQFQWIEGWPGE